MVAPLGLWFGVHNVLNFLPVNLAGFRGHETKPNLAALNLHYLHHDTHRQIAGRHGDDDLFKLLASQD
jgi:hypothetical protein